MPRPHRPQIAGGLYHVTTRGNRRQRIYLERRDSEFFLEALDTVIRRFGWLCHSYCLMPNHYHLLIETPWPNIARGMHDLNSRFSHWFNTRHDENGHLFARRYRSVLIESDTHFLELVRYIALNPVRAGLCDKPEGWIWSSYGGLIGRGERELFVTETRVIEAFSAQNGEGLERIRIFVNEGRPAHDTFTSPGARHGAMAEADG
jgi:putative transposase